MHTKKSHEQTELAPYRYGDPIPVPVVREENSPEIWLKWLRAVAAIERRLADAPTAAAPLA